MAINGVELDSSDNIALQRYDAGELTAFNGFGYVAVKRSRWAPSFR